MAFFLILKEGCRVEQLQLADTERLEVALALYMALARVGGWSGRRSVVTRA